MKQVTEYFTVAITYGVSEKVPPSPVLGPIVCENIKRSLETRGSPLSRLDLDDRIMNITVSLNG